MIRLSVPPRRRIQILMQTNHLLNEQLDRADEVTAHLADLVRRLSRSAPPELAQEALMYLIQKELL
jgi:hypothetical protein